VRYKASMPSKVEKSERSYFWAVGAALLAVVLSAALAGGCGDSSTSATSGSSTSTGTAVATTSNTAAKRAHKESEPAKLHVTIPVLLPKNQLPARYTCYGSSESPAVQWGPVPPGTTEIAVFVANLIPVHGKVVFDWAVTGLKPEVHQIAAGKLPAGAIVGRNGYGKTGYTMCLPKGHREEGAILDLFALSRPLGTKPGFSNVEALWHHAAETAKASGAEGWTYTGP
jgi:phosphatidylethanolamine-binding protein (PEBP) family uncharacterized protein